MATVVRYTPEQVIERMREQCTDNVFPLYVARNIKRLNRNLDEIARQLVDWESKEGDESYDEFAVAQLNEDFERYRAELKAFTKVQK